MSNSFVRALPCVGYSLAGVNTLGGFKVEEISSQSLLAHFLGKCSNTFLIPNICKVECAKNMVIFSSPPPRRGGEGGEGAALALRPVGGGPASPLSRPAAAPHSPAARLRRPASLRLCSCLSASPPCCRTSQPCGPASSSCLSQIMLLPLRSPTLLSHLTALRPGFVVLPLSDYAPASPLPRPAVSPWPRSVVVVVRLLHKS